MPPLRQRSDAATSLAYGARGRWRAIVISLPARLPSALLSSADSTQVPLSIVQVLRRYGSRRPPGRSCTHEVVIAPRARVLLTQCTLTVARARAAPAAS